MATKYLRNKDDGSYAVYSEALAELPQFEEAELPKAEEPAEEVEAKPEAKPRTKK